MWLGSSAKGTAEAVSTWIVCHLAVQHKPLLGQRCSTVSLQKGTSYTSAKIACGLIWRCKNYRPISQLPFISKVLERAVTNRIRPHLEEYHLFDKYQSAYRATHSTETALLRVNHDITSVLDKGSTVGLVMLDQSAAFDVIDHDILPQRLEFAFGISGRAQCVGVGKDVFKTLPVVCGVSKGSVLGPLLCTMCTKSIGEICRRHNVLYHCYADNIQLYCTAEGSEDLAAKLNSMNECIDKLKSWMGCNTLKRNSEKRSSSYLLRKSLLAAIWHRRCLGTCET